MSKSYNVYIKRGSENILEFLSKIGILI